LFLGEAISQDDFLTRQGTEFVWCIAGFVPGLFGGLHIGVEV